MSLYQSIGGAVGCRALATAFYGHVARDPVLRPLFPTTFTCAIEEFSAFLVQFLGGEAEHTQRRWWLSLSESHKRFALGQAERDAWLKAMATTLGDDTIVADAGVRAELLRFFTHAANHMVNTGPAKPSAIRLDGELAGLWDAQRELDEAVALIRAGDAEALALMNGESLRAHFVRSPSVHASVLALAASTNALRAWALKQLEQQPSLARERYNNWRTLLHDAAATGDIELVERLLDLGMGDTSGEDKDRSPLYCVANECWAPTGPAIVHALLQHGSTDVNAIHGVKHCTALHMAARRGNVDVIQALLDGGADIEARDSARETPLRRAVNCSKVDAAKVLLARGANPRSIGSRGLTPQTAARGDAMKAVFGLQTRP